MVSKNSGQKAALTSKQLEALRDIVSSLPGWETIPVNLDVLERCILLVDAQADRITALEGGLSDLIAVIEGPDGGDPGAPEVAVARGLLA